MAADGIFASKGGTDWTAGEVAVLVAGRLLTIRLALLRRIHV
jgi:hypothetical protein